MKRKMKNWGIAVFLFLAMGVKATIMKAQQGVALPFAILEKTNDDDRIAMRGLQANIFTRRDGKLSLTNNDSIVATLPERTQDLPLRWQYAKDVKGTKGKLILRFTNKDGSEQVYEKQIDNLTAKQYQDTTFVLSKEVQKISLQFKRSSASGYIFLKEFQVPVAFVMTDVGYGTFYSASPIVVPEGLTAYTVVAQNEGRLSLRQVAQAGEVVAGGNAVLMQGNAGDYLFKQPETNDYKKKKNLYDKNMLLGSDTAVKLVSSTHYLYKLANDPQQGVAFYWGAVDGAKLDVQAYRAYLRIDRTQYAATQTLVWDNVLTALPPITSSPLFSKNAYDLWGRKVNNTYRGIVLENGRKVWK